ncbi:MAG TPA: hypothetical protein VNL14_10445 [Candidatus Acidoferrales bacterium]|nr:hypothetical protein [Candidatus Acidoferrales bacterium]
MAKMRIQAGRPIHGGTRTRAIACVTAFLPFLALLWAAWMFPDWNPTEAPDWRPVIARAEEARQMGDLYQANTLYRQASRLASWGDDWRGLLAAACGIKKLEPKGSLKTADEILVRAMIAAQAKQSRRGMLAVANAFASGGKSEMAEFVLSRIRDRWPDDRELSREAALPSC